MHHEIRLAAAAAARVVESYPRIYHNIIIITSSLFRAQTSSILIFLPLSTLAMSLPFNNNNNNYDDIDDDDNNDDDDVQAARSPTRRSST